MAPLTAFSTLIFLVVFVGIVCWAWSGGRRHANREAAWLPFALPDGRSVPLYSLYGATKAGLSAYLEGLDHKFREAGLRTVCVKPGFVRTGMTEGLPEPPFAGDADQVAAIALGAIDRGTVGIEVVEPRLGGARVVHAGDTPVLLEREVAVGENTSIELESINRFSDDSGGLYEIELSAGIEQQVGGGILANQDNYGPHFQVINQRLRSLGLKTYTPEEIKKQIAQAEIDAYFKGNPDAALSASRRLGASFMLRGLINAARRAGADPGVLTPELEAAYA